MDKKAFLFCSTISVVLIYSAAAFGEILDQAAAEQLLKGNTVEATDFKFKKNIRFYFEPSGTYKRLDEMNNRETGKWYIEQRGQLCLSFVSGTEKCRSIDSIGDGKYVLLSNTKKSLKFNKVLPGNPYNL